MRLLNTSSHELQEFSQDKIPRYAILSHTWGHNEVSFANIEDGTAHKKNAYNKILGACSQARVDEHQWLWIDTCCIDKKSSAELSEAINSMYAWYENAAVCYAYLSDVQINTFVMNSRWFTRGWTLQELLAPQHVRFYSREWLVIGTKHGLAQTIAKITDIDEQILTGSMSIHAASTARKMSWASERATTRIEDMAYCLMGIFDVNMPLLYGEGDKAFIRLQEEIMKTSDDQSLFAWKEPIYDNPNMMEHHRGLLAKSPAWFMTTGSVFPYRRWRRNTSFSISNKGISIEVPLTFLPTTGLYAAALDCPPSPNQDGFIGIYLTPLSDDDGFARVRIHELSSITSPGEPRTIHVRQDVLQVLRQNNMKPNVYPYHVLTVRKLPSIDTGYTLDNIICPESSRIPARWPGLGELPPSVNSMPSDVSNNYRISKADNQLAVALIFKRFDGTRLFVLMGSATDYGVGFDVVEENKLKTLGDSLGELEHLQRLFKPREYTTEVLTEMSIDAHRVEVRLYTRVHEGVKYFLIHLEIVPVIEGRRSEETLVDH
ncbi:MAG: hypothetical protein OHK93_004945 [Ramalina farinacea]|uniref:Heterokaryon incompatibility domain-containing protein n=1 Tax=Ramalina farinacea TaxID=258253 RepID=A0AA43TYY0_9LECA|nr:hypothetical protein [Ramalina farinacea]